MSKPAWSNFAVCSTTPAFFFAFVATAGRKRMLTNREVESEKLCCSIGVNNVFTDACP
jgi:hypothetical protein